jgi:hypothetical protein
LGLGIGASVTTFSVVEAQGQDHDRGETGRAR